MFIVVLACLMGQFGLILWEKTSDGPYLFLVRATEKIKKTVLDQKISHKIYRTDKCCLSVFGHLTKQVFSKNN